MSSEKIAIIGASSFQNPLILKAKDMGLETHVFAWEAGDIGEKTADYFYPISITDREALLAKCREIDVGGVASIGSDLANIAVAHIAENMGLRSNSVECVRKSTDKHAMRECFAANGDPSPKSIALADGFSLAGAGLCFPIIVKPSDRSGSRGITRLNTPEGFDEAVRNACEESFSDSVLVEEFARGTEYSVEYLSYAGVHHFLSVTEKFTSGAPRFIETAHLEPARLSPEMVERVKRVVEHALTGLGVTDGASHSELKIDEAGTINIIEIGTRMGGDCIGSDLVRLSTGYDFVIAVVQVAMGQEPETPRIDARRHAVVQFIFSQADLETMRRVKADPELQIVFESPLQSMDHDITDSSSRYGYYIFTAETPDRLASYLPAHEREA